MVLHFVSTSYHYCTTYSSIIIIIIIIVVTIIIIVTIPSLIVDSNFDIIPPTKSIIVPWVHRLYSGHHSLQLLPHQRVSELRVTVLREPPLALGLQPGTAGHARTLSANRPLRVGLHISTAGAGNGPSPSSHVDCDAGDLPRLALVLMNPLTP